MSTLMSVQLPNGTWVNNVTYQPTHVEPPLQVLPLLETPPFAGNVDRRVGKARATHTER